MRGIDITNFDVVGAEIIGIPKGDDKESCISAFEETVDIEVPRPKRRGDLVITSQGRKFVYLKGKDIPGFADQGAIDLGVAGTDSLDTYGSRPDLRSQVIGEPMCRLVLMSEEDRAEELRGRLQAQRWGSTMAVATPLPGILNAFAAWRDLPIRSAELPSGMSVSGSIEAMPILLKRWGVELVADRVASGETARENGLVELMPIMNIYPALVQKVEE